jgi:hypothetical protein
MCARQLLGYAGRARSSRGPRLQTLTQLNRVDLALPKAANGAEFSDTHSKTSPIIRSSGERRPAMIRGEGRTPTTAVFAGFI